MSTSQLLRDGSFLGTTKEAQFEKSGIYPFELYQDLRSGMIHRGGGQLSGDVARVWRESISKHSKYTDAWSDERGKMRPEEAGVLDEHFHGQVTFPTFRSVPIFADSKRTRDSLIFYENIYVMFPPRLTDLETSSALSAWVIAVAVRAVQLESQFSSFSDKDKEVFIMYVLLNAQKLAHKAILSLQEKAFLSDDVIDSAAKAIWHKNESYEVAQFSGKKITKNKPHRVTSLLLVAADVLSENVFSITVAENSSHYTLLESNGNSLSLTSCADVVLYRRNFDGRTAFVSHISVSGSYRTVEAAASVVVRMLLENKSPGQAIDSMAVYYHVDEQEKFYCEHDSAMLQLLYAKHGLRCDPFPSKDNFPELHDRTVMAVKMFHDSYKHVLAAMTNLPKFNHPVGF